MHGPPPSSHFKSPTHCALAAQAMRLSFSLMQEQPSHPALPAGQQQQQPQLAGAPAGEQHQDGAGSLALVPQAPGGMGSEADGALRAANRGPHSLPALVRERPELVERVLAMSAEQFVVEWQQLASNFRWGPCLPSPRLVPLCHAQLPPPAVSSCRLASAACSELALGRGMAGCLRFLWLRGASWPPAVPAAQGGAGGPRGAAV